jgi:sialate O-acetylesterase
MTRLHSIRPVRAALSLLGLWLTAAAVHAVELPRVFSDGMVLQRGQPIVVWGRADAGVRIEAPSAPRPARMARGASNCPRATPVART